MKILNMKKFKNFFLIVHGKIIFNTLQLKERVITAENRPQKEIKIQAQIWLKYPYNWWVHHKYNFSYELNIHVKFSEVKICRLTWNVNKTPQWGLRTVKGERTHVIILIHLTLHYLKK